MGAAQSSSSPRPGDEGIVTVATGAPGRPASAAGAAFAASPARPPPPPPPPPTPDDLAAERRALAVLARLAELRRSLPAAEAPAAAVPQPGLASSLYQYAGGAAAASTGGWFGRAAPPATTTTAAATPDASATAAGVWRDLQSARRLTDDTAALSGALAELVGEHRE